MVMRRDGFVSNHFLFLSIIELDKVRFLFDRWEESEAQRVK